MNTQGNTYTFIYSAIMVIVVAALLSFAAMSLQPRQKKNIEVEKKKNILSSVNLGLDVAEQPDKNTYIEGLYSKYIVNSYIVNTKGEKLDGDAFEVDMTKEVDKPVDKRMLPVYIAKLDDGSQSVIVPVRGKGLWGPIWGYVALKEDFNTVYGASFDHKGETPGLGAEISNRDFQQQFIGKTIFNDKNEFVSIDVVKGGAPAGSMHAVDAVSGGTITSNGLKDMLLESLGSYESYFKQKNLSNER